MENNFGFIHDKIDIKILILFVMRRLPGAVDIDKLAALTLCDDGITYFDFAECLAELVQTGHVQTNGIEYTITDKGRRNGEITETSIPYSVRIKAEKDVSAVRAEMQRSTMINASHTLKRGGGYNVCMSLNDELGEIISLKMFAPDEKQAIKMENNFRRNAEGFYGKIIDMLLSGE